jgi:UDPglucose 6-dehydrogenase
MAIVSEAAEGMWNPRYGTEGGRPYSGGCLPKDAEAFLAFACAAGLEAPVLEAVVRVNEDVALCDVRGPLGPGD